MLEHFQVGPVQGEAEKPEIPVEVTLEQVLLTFAQVRQRSSSWHRGGRPQRGGDSSSADA